LLIATSGKRQLEGLPDITDEQWEYLRNTPREKSISTVQEPPPNYGRTTGFLKSSITGAYNLMANVASSFYPGTPETSETSTTESAPEKPQQTVWEKHWESWRLPTVCDELIDIAAEVIGDSLLGAFGCGEYSMAEGLKRAASGHSGFEFRAAKSARKR
jgi:hypothetical protein